MRILKNSKFQSGCLGIISLLFALGFAGGYFLDQAGFPTEDSLISVTGHITEFSQFAVPVKQEVIAIHIDNNSETFYYQYWARDHERVYNALKIGSLVTMQVQPEDTDIWGISVDSQPVMSYWDIIEQQRKKGLENLAFAGFMLLISLFFCFDFFRGK